MSSFDRTLIQHCLDLRLDRAYRDAQKRCLIEGRSLIMDLLKSRPAKRLYLGPGEPMISGADEVVQLPRHLIEKISSTKNPDNIIAEFEKPDYQPLSKARFIVALDGLQDPGNLGTIIRTAFAMGWEGIFLIEPCCDPFNDKALRAAKGATFDMPIQKGSLDELLAIKLPLVAADLHGVRPEEVQKNDGLILLFGSESKGVRKELAVPRVTLPMRREIDSLNVAQAAAILMYLLR